ncbi:glutamyl-tRNA reductase [Rufibacter immobilis]|uniref:Glutamyl-tRNA reductase n=1 Tax=Rufibacter immobilis TaxID=1348778 RepID=A0A3M9MTY7_9BACT|nr:glutamyl-tRNA reductase [Rufibacter immobilis]RNI28198.1 glutamyl-tRNA reductase [Rufibacter immobilis]
MQTSFKALSLSYKTAPIAVREMVSLNEIGCKNLLDKLKEFTSAQEVLVLSTCNRTEVYYSAETDLSKEIIKLIAIEKGFLATSAIAPYFISLQNHDEAVRHLFNVAIGLESQVVGDFQILNQVKNAYQWATQADTVGPFLHRLLHTIFFTNKRVSNETAFRDGAASVAYATVELVEELTQQMENPRVLMLGVGEMGSTVCLNFQKTRIKNVVVANRTHHKAVELAQRANATSIYWEAIQEEIALADVVISSVPGDCFQISPENLPANGFESPKFFLDLSMPRSIAKEVATLPNAAVYNIDTIKNRATEALEKRLASVPAVEQIITESIEEFQNWVQETGFTATVQQFKNRLEEIRQQEVARALKKLSGQERELLESVTKNILNKIVKLPVLELKAACQRGESDALLEGLSSLFQLEKQEA